MSYNFLDAANSLTMCERRSSRKAASDLGQQLRFVDSDLSCEIMPPLVMGEAGKAFPDKALGRIVMGRPKVEGGGPVSQLEAWMQAEIVAAGVAAAHETTTGDIVLPEEEAQLREAFTRFTLSQC